MLYDVDTPEEYINVLEEDWRKTQLLWVRKKIKDICQTLDEKIHYKMLSYFDQKGELFYLNAQQDYVSLYVGDSSKVDPSGELLEGFNLGKGCIRIRKTIDLDSTRLDEFISKTYKMWLNGEDVAC